MSSSKPVVVYGASGYTGRLVAEYLREYNLPFVAAGRNADRVKDVMAHLPGVETAQFDCVGVEHNVDALTELFTGAKVVINTVGPFAKLGPECVQACLNAGCHYTDTTGEQDWMIVCDEQFGERFAEKGLLLSPGVAQMYTTGEIAANLALETPGLDTLDILVLWKGFPTTASTATIFANLLSPRYYLEQNEYAAWTPQTHEVIVPGQHATALALDWGGTSHPVWFKRDPRVANCKAIGGIFDRQLLEGVVAMATEVGAKAAEMEPAEQQKFLAETAASVQSEMPPRENQRINISMDSVHASGPGGMVHAVLRGTCNYKQTGLLNAYAAHCLVRGSTRHAGFGSACQAFGHRELLACLQAFGLMAPPIITGHVASAPVGFSPASLGRL
ncbi:MAG TPA: DUF5938 domain-containing protein [Solirubrobacteraceae bacterium]|nr:DUF5938 domain-containing protein [Solirubrobacteraceae bacterium]